jgi:hypothetical protein
MPFLVMRRADIPGGVLQQVDLWPNTSQRNFIYPPGDGQTGYIRNRPTETTLVGNVALGPPVVASVELTGLAAYLIGNIDTGAGPGDAPFTAAQADAAATAIYAAATAGTVLTLTAVNAILAAQVAATELNAQGSTGVLTEVLGILSGRVYTIAAGTEMSDGAGLFVARSGAFTDAGEFRPIYDTGRLRVSLLNGNLSLMKGSTFTYLGTTGAAIVVYDDDGTVM